MSGLFRPARKQSFPIGGNARFAPLAPEAAPATSDSHADRPYGLLSPAIGKGTIRVHTTVYLFRLRFARERGRAEFRRIDPSRARFSLSSSARRREIMKRV
jgi:hypothetical protein